MTAGKVSEGAHSLLNNVKTKKYAMSPNRTESKLPLHLVVQTPVPPRVLPIGPGNLHPLPLDKWFVLTIPCSLPPQASVITSPIAQDNGLPSLC